MTLDTNEGAAYGAALLASVGAGFHRSVDDAVASVVSVRPAASVTDPTPYEAPFRTYAALYPALRPTFDAADAD